MARTRKNPDTLDLKGLRDCFKGTSKSDWGVRVRNRRKSMGITLEGLASAIGGEVRMQTISKVELGEIVPRDYLRAAIALRLGCPVEELFPYPNLATLTTAAS